MRFAAPPLSHFGSIAAGHLPGTIRRIFCNLVMGGERPRNNRNRICGNARSMGLYTPTPHESGRNKSGIAARARRTYYAIVEHGNAHLENAVNRIQCRDINDR